MEITIHLSDIVFYIGLFTTISLFILSLHREEMKKLYIKEKEILLQEKEAEYKAMYDKKYLEILSSTTIDKEVEKFGTILDEIKKS